MSILAAAGCTSLLGDFDVAESGEGADAASDQTLGGDVVGGDSAPARDSGPGLDGGACMPGTACHPTSCQSGVVTCDGGTTCEPLGNLTNGTACNDGGGVCDNGTCVACNAGTDCSDASSCQAATIACGSGAPVCATTGPAENGRSCGTNMYCNDGTCAACTNDASCAPPPAPCDNGSVLCVDGGLTCRDLGTPAPPGTNCGTNQVCNGDGGCIACTAGNQCNPVGNLCKTGTTSCATGASTCANLTDVGAGISCGTNQVCDGKGSCVACTTGATCNPGGNKCQTGKTACSSGAPTCTNVTNVGPGVSCGANTVCDGKGSCVPICTPANCASGCCDPTTQACTAYASQTSTSCGHAGGQCHSCAVGTSTPACTADGTCAPTLIGQIGTYSDVTDIDTDGTTVWFVDSANSEVAQVSAHSIGTPVVLSGALPGVQNVVYDSVSSLVVFDVQGSSTTTLYSAQPGVAGSATKGATVTGLCTTQSLAIGPLGTINLLTATSSTVTPYNCSSAASCGALGAGFASSLAVGTVWPASQSEPYWADYKNGALVTWVQSAGAYSDFASGLTSPAAPATDGTYVYWLQSTGTLQIQRKPIAGGAVQNLGIFGDNNQVQDLSTDGKYLYWAATLGGVTGIYYMPVAGGPARYLTKGGQLWPVKVHKDNASGQPVVYFGDTIDATLSKIIAPP